MILGQLKNINVSYNNKDLVLEKLNLDIYQGELLSLLGPSGCGKSTTLNTIAGFLDVMDGSFILENQDYTKKAINHRNFGIVFQNYALFPHMNVFDNVAFGLKLRKVSKDKLEKDVLEMIKICGLEGLEKRLPKNLSGGQRQRVALARALVIKPKLLLLDEPLSNLDAQLRITMRNEIKRIVSELKITTIFVTHDQEECFAISDRVAIMKDGKIKQIGSPEEIYNQPNSEYVARFVGFENFLTYNNQKICIRPKDIEIREDGNIDGVVLFAEFLGDFYQLAISTQFGTIMLEHNEKLDKNDQVKIKFNEEKIIYLGEKK